jgi:alpha-L-rhamnosidase
MGDAAVFWPAAAYNMDVEAFTHRFMGDVRLAQRPDGQFPDCIPPFILPISRSAPGWADAGVILPHTVWRQYGDTGVVADNWDAMERYLAFILEKNPGHLWKSSKGSDYGDWLAVDAKYPGEATTPKDLIGTAFWAADAAMMRDMAHAIGKTGAADRYAALFETIRSAFQAAYVAADGQIGNGSQTSYVLAIRFGLLSPEQAKEAGRRLAANVAARGGKLSTGFLGTPHILDALADTGQEATAIGLLLQRDYPSWGYMVAKGATTMWERWNSDTGDLSMNSYNHYAFGAIGAFLFRRVAGLEALEPGFRKVRIAPIFDRRLGHAGADYDAVTGRFTVDWRFVGEQVDLMLTLPPGSEGEVVLPASVGAVRLGGKTLSPGQRPVQDGPVCRFHLDAGAWRIRFAV